MTAQKEKRFSLEALITLILAAIVWIFSAGILWNKVDELEMKVDRIERVLIERTLQTNSRK